VIVAIFVLSQSASIELQNIPIPNYPPIAQAARVSGDVAVNVEVRLDGSVASAALATPGDTDTLRAFLEPSALDAARNARFTCRRCSETLTPYSLVFAFRFESTRRHPGGEVVAVSPSRSRIQVVTENPICDHCGGGPTHVIARDGRRAMSCLWLWECRSLPDESASGEPEVRRVSWRVPSYPARAVSAFVTGDVEITAHVRRDGSLESAVVASASDSGDGTLAPLFAAAALSAARDTEFSCASCGGVPVAHSLRYAFRLPNLARGYLAPAAADAIVAVADIPVLSVPLRVAPESLPAGCRPASILEAAEGGLAPPTNPWTRAEIAAVVSRLSNRDDPYISQLAAGIEEAYAAWYVQPDGARTAVYGLRFDHKNDARSFVEATSGGAARSAAILENVVVAAVQGSSACADAIASRFTTGTRR
jgi:TonB family protein